MKTFKGTKAELLEQRNELLKALQATTEWLKLILFILNGTKYYDIIEARIKENTKIITKAL